MGVAGSQTRGTWIGRGWRFEQGGEAWLQAQIVVGRAVQQHMLRTDCTVWHRLHTPARARMHAGQARVAGHVYMWHRQPSAGGRAPRTRE